MTIDLAKIDRIIDDNGAAQSALLAILQDIQSEANYLPREALERVAERLNVPEGRIYAMATFFRSFSLKPRGKHICTVCMGTACHVRGAPRILDEMERTLKLKSGETSADMQFTLETVNCVGACALGPLMIIDGEYHGKITPAQVNKTLKNMRK
jgi:NADH-quinone oxidoreductase subunit E